MRLSAHVFEKFTLALTAHEQTTMVTLVLYKHNEAAKHGSSKPLTTNELWLLELQKSTRILASMPDALWDMCKLSIGLPSYQIGRGIQELSFWLVRLKSGQ